MLRWTTLLLLLGPIPVAAAGPPNVARPPHMLVLLADDVGWNDVGFHGSEIRTPRIDALAARGLRLDHFYVHPTCSGTRASLMTGRYPMRMRMQAGVVLPWSQWGMPLEERTLAEALREVGYRTALVGKWHLGSYDAAYLPRARGFDHHYGSYLGELDHFEHSYLGGLDWHRNGQPVYEEGYDTDLLADEAVRLVEEHDRAQPLFLLVAFTAPHAPLQAPAECLRRAEHIEIEVRRVYAAMVSCMDQAIGRILRAYRRRGMLRNTVVLFASDNGASPYAWVHGGLNTPLRGGKGSVSEGGVRVPAVLAWPRKLAAGVYEPPLHIVDLYTTLLSLAGASTEQPLPLDGVDAWRALRRGRPARGELLHNLNPYVSAIRWGRWKLIRTPSSLELFDIEHDPGETRNRAADRPRKLALLLSQLEAYARVATLPRPISIWPPPGFVAPEVWGPPSAP